ncbi:hypothetical protein, partial [Rhodovarius sp.]|uniref:hypothetical protein n=1 Tax=Rhodovarius sp. TaxID=2972673 RepID=UPI003341C825
CRAASQLGGQPVTDWFKDCKFRLVAAHLHQSMDPSRDHLMTYGEFPQDNHVDLEPHTEIGESWELLELRFPHFRQFYQNALELERMEADEGSDADV